MSFTHRISPDDLHRIDKSDMAGHISRMGTHLRETVQLCSALTLPISGNECTGVIILGMGGSAIGGDLARSYLTGKLSIPVTVNRSYELPSYANAKTLIIASSYSGNTEETLSAFEQAVAKKLPILCITTGGTLGKRAKELNLPVIIVPGGMQPRAALAYSFVPILLALEKLGITSGESENLERAASLLDSRAILLSSLQEVFCTAFLSSMLLRKMIRSRYGGVDKFRKMESISHSIILFLK
jgi:glucose/mannose-6-phosphate isomerase